MGWYDFRALIAEFERRGDVTVVEGADCLRKMPTGRRCWAACGPILRHAQHEGLTPSLTKGEARYSDPR